MISEIEDLEIKVLYEKDEYLTLPPFNEADLDIYPTLMEVNIKFSEGNFKNTIHKRRRHCWIKFKGAALIMALFVTAIIASVSAGLFSMVSTNLENEKNMISEQQAILTTLSLESFTKKYLKNKENRNNIVLAANNFSQKSPINLPLERGNLEANIVDMAQCFNLIP